MQGDYRTPPTINFNYYFRSLVGSWRLLCPVWHQETQAFGLGSVARHFSHASFLCSLLLSLSYMVDRCHSCFKGWKKKMKMFLEHAVGWSSVQ